MGRTFAKFGHWVEQTLIHTSLGKTILLIVGCGIVFMQTVLVWRDMETSRAEVARAAEKRADAALDMLAAVHSQAMVNRKGMGDGDGAIATLNGSMNQFSRSKEGVKVWLVMGNKVEVWQRKTGSAELELPRDAIDRRALASGKTQSSVSEFRLRKTRPVVLGQGMANIDSCTPCHSGLMGSAPGETFGAYSAEVDLGPERAVWLANAKDEAWRAAMITALILAGIFTLLRFTLRPLERLTGATLRLAGDDLDSSVRDTHRPDEIGKIARALDSFRLQLLDKRKLAAENDYNSYLAQHDALTGLPNRLQFNNRFDEAIMQAEATHRRVLGVIADIDRFKTVNDRHGHEAGDALLRNAATNLMDVLGEGEFAARMGGDEFGLFKLFEHDREAVEFLERIDLALRAPLTANSVLIQPVASIGSSVWPSDSRRREQIVNNADLAMYRAKADTRKKRYAYDPKMDEASRKRTQLVEDLSAARMRNELSVQFQRQNDAHSCEVVGYEALCRWNHPKHGPVSPVEFIELAEESGLICEIGEWVLREACAAGARQAGDMSIAVNVSAVQLNDPKFPRLVHQILIDTGFPPARLELELTETALISNRDRALHALRQLKALGIRIAVDDFGVGYSSLQTVSLFPIDKIKIDRSFVIDSDHHPKAQALIRVIMTMGEALNIPVLAEGIETIGQLQFMREAGCAHVQGYLFGKPCCEAEMLEPVVLPPEVEVRKAA